MPKKNPFHGAFPAELRALVAGHYALLQGGLEYDGSESGSISEDEIKRECELINEKDIVIYGAFSPLSSVQEERAADLVRKYLPHARSTLS